MTNKIAIARRIHIIRESEKLIFTTDDKSRLTTLEIPLDRDGIPAVTSPAVIKDFFCRAIFEDVYAYVEQGK
jgi:hypothetical protein